MIKQTLLLFTVFLLLTCNTGYCQKSLLPYEGEYRAGTLIYKTIYKSSDYNDPSSYPHKKIDYQIIIEPNSRIIKFKDNSISSDWDFFKISGNPKFERFLDDKGEEIQMSGKTKAKDNYGEYCEIALGVYKSSGVFRLIIDYPNKMFYSYDFVKAKDWDNYQW
jgi:hypothetical protein